MKFLLHEHEAITEAISNANRKAADFSFVKKRGKLHIVCDANQESFVFYRKSETILNGLNQWEKVSTYILHQPLPKRNIESWEVMMVLFKEWLTELR